MVSRKSHSMQLQTVKVLSSHSRTLSTSIQCLQWEHLYTLNGNHGHKNIVPLFFFGYSFVLIMCPSPLLMQAKTDS